MTVGHLVSTGSDSGVLVRASCEWDHSQHVPASGSGIREATSGIPEATHIHNKAPESAISLWLLLLLAFYLIQDRLSAERLASPQNARNTPHITSTAPIVSHGLQRKTDTSGRLLGMQKSKINRWRSGGSNPRPSAMNEWRRNRLAKRARYHCATPPDFWDVPIFVLLRSPDVHF